jgi:hypothetical protein
MDAAVPGMPAGERREQRGQQRESSQKHRHRRQYVRRGLRGPSRPNPAAGQFTSVLDSSAWNLADARDRA